jgi:hypothetical protein
MRPSGPGSRGGGEGGCYDLELLIQIDCSVAK